MDCNCININNGGAVFRHVYGNVLRMAIPLTVRTVELVDGEATTTDADFIPSQDYPVEVILQRENRRAITIEATMRDGNIAYIEDLGTVPVGQYAITVMCKDDNGNPYRFKQNDVLNVVDTTAEAGIEKGIEYDVTVWYLDSAIYLVLKGEDGVGIEDIVTETSGEIGGTNTVTIILSDGRQKSFTVMNGSGAVDGDFNPNSNHPVSNSVITERFNAVDTAIAGLFGDVDYDSQTKSIRFYNKNKSAILATLDAKPFIKDGMVNSVYISNNTLVITFNTDAGREAIGVPLTSVFNPNNYYTKVQVDSRIATALDNLNLSNYYTKSQTDRLVGKKADVSNDGKVPASESTPVVLDYIYAPAPGPVIPINPQAGEVIYFANEHKIRRYYYEYAGQSGGLPAIVYVEETPSRYVVYYNKRDEKFYRYDAGSLSMVEIETGSGGGEGTVTGVKVGGTTYEPTNGVVDISASIPDVSGFATAGDVADAVADLVDSAPATLDTLNELAAALGDDPNFATAMTTALGNKVDKVTGKGLSTEDYTTAEKTKLAGIATGAEVNVQADWNETNTSSDAYIANKPTIPDAQIQADWNQTTTTAKDYIKNKPDVPTAISVNQQSYPLNNNHAFAIPDYYTKTQIDNAGYVKAQRTLINMDDSNGLVFTDVNDDPLTHSQVIAMLEDESVDLVIKYNDIENTMVWDMRCCYSSNEDGVYQFYSVNADQLRTLFLINDDGSLLIDESFTINIPNAGDVAFKSNTVTNVSYNSSLKKIQKTIDGLTTDVVTLADVATSGSYNDLSNKPTIPSAQVNADWNASSGVAEILNKPTIPTKFSDLVDDSDYIKAEDVASIVVGSADVVITETASHICITFVTSSITFTPNTTMSLWSGQKVGTLTVSGTHLKQDITLTVPANFTAQVSGGTAAQSITIPQTGGEVTGVSVTITYTGADSGSYNGSITATSGSATASVGLVYSQYQGATIIAGTISTIKAAMGGSQVGELNVSGVNLEGDITASVGSGDFAICATQNGTYGLSATISKASAEASGGATLYVKYTPSSGTSTASGTLTLSTPKDSSTTTESVSLSGKVSGTLSITPSTSTIGIASGGSGTAQFTVQGTYLTPASTASVAVSGTGMSTDKQSLTVGQDGTINEVVTVAFSGSADSNGTLTVNHADVDNAATASIAGVITTPLPVDAEFQVGKLKYKVLSGQSTVSVAQISSSATTGDIVIPSTVNDSGVTATLTDSSTQLGVGCTYTVTTIASSGFNGNKNITSLVLPNTITTMGVNGIRDLSNNGMTSFVIPNSVTSISANNLYGMTKLTSLTIGSGVTVLPDYFMGSCEAMRSITIPNNVTEIKSYAFAKNTTTSFTDVDLGSGLTKIGANSYFRMTDNGVVTIRYTGGVISIVGAVFRNQSGGYPTTATLYVPSSLVDTYKTAPGFGVNNGGGWHLFDPNNIYAIQE